MTVTPLRRTVPIASVQGTLALDLGPALDVPAPGQPSGRHAGDVVPIDRRERAELESWSRRYAQAVVEIVSGDRPASQLVRWHTKVIHGELARRAAIVARAGLHQAGQGRGRRPVVRPQVVSARTCFVAPGIAEVSIHVRHGERSRALAARFERTDGRWLATALEFC
jgi:hypothetical protein